MQSRRIPGQLSEGSLITIHGSIPPNASGFSINFMTGPGDIGSCDTLAHINPRFNESVVVFNSHLRGGWGGEERKSGLPVQRGQSFECIILVRNDVILVSFNGHHMGEYRHRDAKERATHVMVKGDVQFNNIFFSGPGMFGGYGQQGGFGQLQSRQIPGQLYEGSLITIHGATPPNATGFSINFMTGPGDIGSCDTLAHINPRFNENVVVFNSHLRGGWGGEERTSGLPVQRGQSFECIILVRNDVLMVSFNGFHYGEFRHRDAKERATHLMLKGDVQLNNVYFSGSGMFGGAAPYGGGSYGQQGYVQVGYARQGGY